MKNSNQELLTTELVKHIFGILGLAHPFIPNLIGITFDKFSNSSISIDYDGIEEKTFPIYSATTGKSLNNSTIKVMGIYLLDEDNYELCAAFRCNEDMIFGIKLSSYEDGSIFLSSKGDGVWEKPSILEKLLACSGLELLNDVGIVWRPSPTDDLLHSSLLQLIDM